MQSTVKTYLQPAFLICVITLGIAASSMSVAVKSFGVYLKKEPLPLKKPLNLLNQNELGQYRVIAKEKITNEDIIKALGTEDYIEWFLEDTEVPANSAVRQCMLFITYYELPDRVPHVPEECYTGGGHQKMASEVLTIKLDGIGGQKYFSNSEISVKYLTFVAKNSEEWWSSDKFSVLYLFRVNDEYTNSREDTRIALNKNIFGKYSYFSKVEWKFFNMTVGQKIYPGKEEVIAASRKLLSVILPVLEREHWPEVPESGRRPEPGIREKAHGHK